MDAPCTSSCEAGSAMEAARTLSSLVPKLHYSTLLVAMLVLTLPGTQASIPLCGRMLVAKMFLICEETDCSELPQPTVGHFDLLTECCLVGCPTERIASYCCADATALRASPFRPAKRVSTRNRTPNMLEVHKQPSRLPLNPLDLGY